MTKLEFRELLIIKSTSWNQSYGQINYLCFRLDRHLGPIVMRCFDMDLMLQQIGHLNWNACNLTYAEQCQNEMNPFSSRTVY